MRKLGYLILLMIVFTSSLVFSEISVSEPLDVYNLGDRLYVSTDGVVGVENGNLNIDLVCGNHTIDLVKIPARAFSAKDTHSYAIPYKILNNEDLEIKNLSDILGDCQVVSSIGSSVAITKTFSITNNINVIATLNKSSYNPGEAITINIEATKENGDKLNGFVKGNNASDFDRVIENGFVSEIFSMPETAEAGIYYLNLNAYDVDRDSILNRGSTTVSFNINQIASSIVMSLSDTNVIPGDNFTVGAEVFDQSGIKMDGTVSFKIMSPMGELIKTTAPNNGFVSIDFAPNSTAGVWSIIASFNDLSETREFEVSEFQKVDFDFENSILSITNTGNTLYNRSLSIDIGGKTTNLDLKIGIGDVRKFNINAPSGEYDVVINDGENSINRQVLLTGSSIKISDFREVGFLKRYSIVWIFFIVILGAIGVIFFIKYKKTKTINSYNIDSGGQNIGVGRIINKIFGQVSKKVPDKIKSRVENSLNFTNKSPEVQGLDQSNYSHEDNTMLDLTKRNIMNAESTLVLNGEKYISAIISLSVKNYEQLGDIAKSALHKAVAVVQKKKGLIDWRGDYVFIVFSPIITKTYKNEALATKEGMEILENLNEYNKKFKDKIEFNLGVHVGELVASKVGGRLKYTSIGNTVSLAKRISDSDNGKLIVSEEIRKKLMRDLKVTKAKEIGGNQSYEVNEVRNRTEDRARLKDLLKRNN